MTTEERRVAVIVGLALGAFTLLVADAAARFLCHS